MTPFIQLNKETASKSGRLNQPYLFRKGAVMIVEDRRGVMELVVTGPWTAEAAAAAKAGEIERLVLNHTLGFNEPSLDFLEGLPIRELVILDRRLTSLHPIHSLGRTLRALSVGNTNRALQIDLNQLPELCSLSAAWPQVERAISVAHGVRDVFLSSYQPADLTPLASLSHLTKLVFKDRPKLRSLAGLAAFPELRVLGIYLAMDLADIDDLDGRSEIEDLALEACRKIVRLDALAGCVALRRLNISECGDLASLAPIRALSHLEYLSIYGSTKILDNDLDPITELPRLRQLRIQSRRSYRPSSKEIQALLPRT